MSNKVLTRISTWFAYSDSEREFPDIDIESGTTSKWVENVGKYAIGKYLWVLWRYHYDDNSYINSNPVCITGQPGIGVSIKQLYIQYYLSTSKTECIGGYWSNTLPTTSNQRYTWTRWYIEFDNGEFNYTNPMCAAGIEGPAGPQGESGVAYSSNLTKDSDQVFCRKTSNGVYVADGAQTITTILEVYENDKLYKIQESQLVKNPNVSNPTFKILDNGCVEVVIAYKDGEAVYPSYEIKVKLSEDTYIIKNFIVYYRFGDYDYDLVVDKKVLAVSDIGILENAATIKLSITEKYRKNADSTINNVSFGDWSIKGLSVKYKYVNSSTTVPAESSSITVAKNAPFQGLYIYLYLNGVEIQTEYIESVKNGANGKDGKDGEDGEDALSQIELHLYCKDPDNLTWSFPEIINSVHCNNDGTATVGNNYYDNVYWCSDKVDGIAYTCSASFGGTITNYDEYTKYTVNKGTIKFTEWTISDISYLQEAFGKDEVNAEYAVTLGKVLAVTDSDSNDKIVAGITNGSTIDAGNTKVTPPMIFAGANGITNANDANFTVSKDGIVRAKKLFADVLYKTVVEVNPSDWIKTVDGSTVNKPYTVSCDDGMIFNIKTNETAEQFKILLPGGLLGINNKKLLPYLGSYIVVFLPAANVNRYCIEVNGQCLASATCNIFQCELINQDEFGQTGIPIGFVHKGSFDLTYDTYVYGY